MQTLFSCSNHCWDKRFSRFQHLEGPWRIPGGSLEVPEGPWGAPWRSLESPWRVPGGPLGIPEGPWGPWRYLEGPWRVPGGPLDHQMLCFPRNLKGSVPGVPDANPVQLFKSLLGQTFQHHWFGTPSFRYMGKALCKRSRKRGTPRSSLPGSR